MAHVFCLPAACGKRAGRMKMPYFLWLPRVSHKRLPLFCHCSSEPIMSLTLSAGVFSLLPAAVSFSTVLKIAFASPLMGNITKL